MSRRKYRYKKRQDDLQLNQKRVRALLLCVAACALLFVAVVDLAWAGPALRIASGIGAVLVAAYLITRTDPPDFVATALGRPEPVQPSEEDVTDAASYVLRNYSAESLNCFIHLLLDGPRFLSRVHEDVVAAGRGLAVRTTLQFRVNMPSQEAAARAAESPSSVDGAPGTGAAGSDATADPALIVPADADEAQETPMATRSVLVPIALARKGYLFDGFRVVSADGTTLPTLTQWETRGLTSLAVEALFRLAKVEGADAAPSWTLSSADREIMWDVITSAVCQVAANRRPNAGWTDRERAERRARSNAQNSALEKIKELSADISPYWKEKIGALCRVFAESYVVVAEVPPPPHGQNLVIQYSSVYSPEHMHLSAYEQLRSRYGLSPTAIDVPMTRALHADSYHFEVTAPPGSYVFSHHLESLSSREPLKQPDLRVGDVQQYARVYHEDGRSTAHLYIRQQGARPDIVRNKVQELDRPDLKSIVRFREIPPGALGNAAMLATLSAIVIAFFGVSRVGIDAPAGSAGLPALILALPAFIASALGRGMDHEKMARAPLTAFFGLYLVTVLSLGSALLYVLEASKSLEVLQAAQLAGERSIPTHLPIPGQIDLTLLGGVVHVRTDIYWILIFATSAVLAACLNRERRNAMQYYLDIAERHALDATAPSDGARTEGGR